MNGIDSVKHRYRSFFLSSKFLNASNQLVPFFWSVGMTSAIENAAHLQVNKDILKFGCVQTMGLFEGIGGAYAHHVEGELGHFAGLVFQTHGGKDTVYKRRLAARHR